MALVVRTNTAAGNALNQLNTTSRALSRSFERLSTGKRIARAADDAAGLGVAENLQASAASAAVAARNTNDGISMIAIAEGASAEVGSILTRMRELAVQASSETLGTTERGYVDAEYESLASEIDRIAQVTEFNGRALTDGTFGTISAQVGIRNTANDRIDITLGDLQAATLGVDAGSVDLSDITGARAALDTLDAAISTVSGYRAGYGASENRLTSALTSLGQFEQTTTEAESRIRDADFGFETASLSRNQILQQAGVSVLAQANAINQAAVQLLN
jgi:flagellin